MPAGASDPPDADAAPAGIGFCGKLPSHGDFLHRRIPHPLLRQWEDVLDAGMAATREALGDDWLRPYLSCPIWRFAASPACLGTAAAGVMMPSVDRAGRYYPLTILSPLSDAVGAGAMTRRADWYDRIELLALSCLADDFVFDEFDAKLAALEPPLPDAPDDASPVDLALRALDAQPTAFSLWWTVGSEAAPATYRHYPGLPGPADFVDLIAGHPVG